MKRLAVQTNHAAQELSTEVVASLSHTPETNLQFRSVNGGNRRTVRRPASQQSVVRQHNTNPYLRRALPVVVGGTSDGISLDLQFPQFTGIATRRDAPLLPLQMMNGFKPVETAPATASELTAHMVAHKFDSLSQYKPLFRDRGIND